jgi:hypothetical protein
MPRSPRPTLSASIGAYRRFPFIASFSRHVALLAFAAAAPAAPAGEAVLINPTGRACKDEILRLGVPPTGPAGSFVVKLGDAEVPYLIDERDGKPEIWIRADFAPGERKKIQVAPGKPQAFTPAVTVKKDCGHYILDNGQIGVKAPAEGSGGEIPGPVTALKVGDKWLGGSFWKSPLKLKAFTATLVGDGAVLGKIRLRYEFDGKAGLNGDVPAFAEVDVSLGPGWQHAELVERHEMPRGSYWEFEASKGWAPKQGISSPFSGGMSKDPAPPRARDLKPIAHCAFREDMFINLIPRWNQGCRDGWHFVATDGALSVAAAVVRASQWIWPHNNAIEVIVKDSGGYAGLRAPTWKGRRVWWLMAPKSGGGDEAGKALGAYVMQHAFEHLDKLNHEVIADWPGSAGTWGGTLWAFSGINPTGGLRGEGKSALAGAGKPGKYGALVRMQSMIHADVYGTYYNYWSPQNPNFFTDFFKPAIAYASNLKEHPRFEDLRRQSELKFKEDIYHAVTLPGGAGQECPGYSYYAVHHYEGMAEICKAHLGFDPTRWERLKAAKRFAQRITQPAGDTDPSGAKRRWLYMGDTHPGKPLWDIPLDDVKSWKTEELPGFGAIFNHKPGTPEETYVSFKSGPNRGHYHGDQLSITFSASARQLAVDHHCSYGPRADQEHMHNRVAFFTEKMPYANMDGYERLIAFKTSEHADVAMGQVESERIHPQLPKPPANWHQEYPQHRFATPLTYRRTVVLVKGGPKDYAVLRDQYWAPEPLGAAYCLHVVTDKIEPKGQTVDFGNLTLLCAKPAQFKFVSFPWEHGNGGREHTEGARLEIQGAQGEFVTVLYPGPAPAWSAVPGGVKVGDDEITFAGDKPTAGDDAAYATVKRAGKVLVTLAGKDVDLDRSQGEIGLFVPDMGYPFGEIPDWLIRQRAKINPWALKTDRELQK